MHRTVVTGTFSCSIAAVVDLALLQKWLIRPDLKHTNLCLSTASMRPTAKTIARPLQDRRSNHAIVGAQRGIISATFTLLKRWDQRRLFW